MVEDRKIAEPRNDWILTGDGCWLEIKEGPFFRGEDADGNPLVETYARPTKATWNIFHKEIRDRKIETPSGLIFLKFFHNRLHQLSADQSSGLWLYEQDILNRDTRFSREFVTERFHRLLEERNRTIKSLKIQLINLSRDRRNIVESRYEMIKNDLEAAKLYGMSVAEPKEEQNQTPRRMSGIPSMSAEYPY